MFKAPKACQTAAGVYQINPHLGWIKSLTVLSSVKSVFSDTCTLNKAYCNGHGNSKQTSHYSRLGIDLQSYMPRCFDWEVAWPLHCCVVICFQSRGNDCHMRRSRRMSVVEFEMDVGRESLDIPENPASLVLKHLENLQAVFVWQIVFSIMTELPLLPSLSRMRKMCGHSATGVSIKIEALLGLVRELISKHKVWSLTEDNWLFGYMKQTSGQTQSLIEGHGLSLSNECTLHISIYWDILNMDEVKLAVHSSFKSVIRQWSAQPPSFRTDYCIQTHYTLFVFVAPRSILQMVFNNANQQLTNVVIITCTLSGQQIPIMTYSAVQSSLIEWTGSVPSNLSLLQQNLPICMQSGIVLPDIFLLRWISVIEFLLQAILYIDLQCGAGVAGELMEYWQVILPILISHLKSAATGGTDGTAISTGLTLIQAMQQIVETSDLLSHRSAESLLNYVLDNGDLWLDTPRFLKWWSPKAAAFYCSLLLFHPQMPSCECQSSSWSFASVIHSITGCFIIEQSASDKVPHQQRWPFITFVSDIFMSPMTGPEGSFLHHWYGWAMRYVDELASLPKALSFSH